MSAGSGGRREVAHRVFAAEYDDANHSYSESDEERAPNYVVTPTGARVNRLFAVGVLTECESVSEEVVRARVVDPTGAFVLYAGQYQPDERAYLERAEPPAFVAVTGKARTFQPDDSERVFTSVRPESINTVDAATRDRWTVHAAEQTLARVQRATTALSTGLVGDELRLALEQQGFDESAASGIAIAVDHYGTTPTYLAALRDLALDAARVVAGEREEVRGLDVGPAAEGDITATDLAETLADATPLSGRDRSGSPTAETGDGTGSLAARSAPETDTASDVDADTTDSPVEETVAEKPQATETVATDTTGTDTGGDDVVDDTGDSDAAAGPTDSEDLEYTMEASVREAVEEEHGVEFQTGTEVDEPGEADIETPVSDAGEGQTNGDAPDRERADTVDTDDGPGEFQPASGDEPSGTGSDGRGQGARSDDEPAVVDGDGDDTATAPAKGEADTPPTVETEPESESTATVEETESESTPAEADPEDDQAAVMTVMRDLDDGSGADREELTAELAARYDMSGERIQDAISDALMDGQCYEPDGQTLKPI